MKSLIIYNHSSDNSTLSYHYGWTTAFKNSKLFDCDFLNLNNFFPIYKAKPNIEQLNYLLFKKYDCIILLHSVFSNACLMPYYIQKILRYKKAFKVFFVGNEYKHMPEKISFTKNLNIDLFITQSHLENIKNLYRDALQINVEYICNVGIDEKIFFPKIDYNKRKILVGYRTYPEPLYLGNQERVRLYKFLKKYSRNMKNNLFDLSIDHKDRFEYGDWANFLNNCKCLISANTGSDYFFLNDDLRRKVNNSKIEIFDQVFETFFKNMNKGDKFRCLTGKVIEPAACKTSLILVEGDYDKFKANIHYISLKKDYSNMGECIEKLNDQQFINTIIQNSYELVKSKYLYTHHLDKLYKIVKIKI